MSTRPPTAARRTEWLLVKAFGLTILLGGCLLALPVCGAGGKATPLIDSLFMATSATCVTGLATVDPGSGFSTTGQVILLALMQFGGLGIMTISTFLLLLVGRRLDFQNEFVLQSSLGTVKMRGLRSLLRRTMVFTLCFEAIGMLILAGRFHVHHGMNPGQALYNGLFHAVSAFCNAGLGLRADSLIGWREDKVVVITIALLIVCGGLGFLVLHNLSLIRFWHRNRFTRGQLTLHSRVVLKTTGVLILVGWVAFALFEWQNTLAPLHWGDRLTNAFFQGVTPRTAGFNVVDMAALHPVTFFMVIALMFIGGSPCSTAGGIKTTTLVVLVALVRAMMSGRTQISIGNRGVSLRVVREAMSIFLLAIVLVAVFFGVLMVTEHPPVLSRQLTAADELLFEAVSAFGTVGLSTGITPQLSTAGKICIMLLMFIGRLGPLTLALVIGKKEVSQRVRFPEEDVIVG